MTPKPTRFRHLKSYFLHAIWDTPPTAQRPISSVLRRLSRYLYLIVRGLFDDEVLLRASALTYRTMLALVPLLALVVSLAKGFGLQRPILEASLVKVTGGQQEIVLTLFDYVDNTSLAALGTIGFLALIYLAINVFGQIEDAFNAVWGVSEGRSFRRKLTDYLSVFLIWPILILASTGITAFLKTSPLVNRLLSNEMVSEVTKLGVRSLPLITVWAAFTFAYAFLPNTRVRFRAALVGGVVAGSIWQASQIAYIALQIGVARYNVIYGGFAFVPVFFVWLNLSWVIVLLGTEVAFAVQHERTYHPPLPEGALVIAKSERAALQILERVWRRFREGEPPLDAGDVAAEIDLPRQSSLQVVRGLLASGLVTRSSGLEDGLLPARDLSGLGVGELLLIYRSGGKTTDETDSSTPVDAVHARIEAAIRDAGSEPLGSLGRPRD